MFKLKSAGVAAFLYSRWSFGETQTCHFFSVPAGHLVVGSPPQAFQHMSTFAAPVVPQTTATPTSTVSSQMESAQQIASQQQQFYPFQFLQQPQEMLFQPPGPDTNCLPHTGSLPK